MKSTQEQQKTLIANLASVAKQAKATKKQINAAMSYVVFEDGQIIGGSEGFTQTLATIILLELDKIIHVDDYGQLIKALEEQRDNKRNAKVDE